MLKGDLTVPLKADRRTRYMHLEPTEAWCLLRICAGIVAGLLIVAHLIKLKKVAHLIKLKKNVPLFYCWLGAIAVLGGAAAFFLPIAVNSGFAKDDDGSALRQAILYTTGGLLAVITLGETHRKNNQEREKNENDHTRQIHAERRSRYTKAVEQLADEKATIRIGGIYTLVKLAGEWLEDKTTLQSENDRILEAQTVIDTLTSYIRAPFPLARRREILELGNPPQEYDGNFLRDCEIFKEEQWVRRTIFDKMCSEIKNIDEQQARDWNKIKFDFTESVIFYPLSNLTFKNPIFKRARFYGEADFSDSRIIGVIDFDSVIFYGPAKFHHTSFVGYANFSPATFLERAEFTPSTFEGYADFRKTCFVKSSNFERARFRSSASFSETSFGGSANFKKTHFEKVADFRTATFFRETTFDDAFFSSYPVFSILDCGEKYNSKFSYIINPGEYNFKINCQARISRINTEKITVTDGRVFTIPVDCELFDPEPLPAPKPKESTE